MSMHCAELEPGRIKNNVIVVILMPVINTVHRDIHTHTHTPSLVCIVVL